MFQIGRLVFDLAFENNIRAAVVAHPSLLKPEFGGALIADGRVLYLPEHSITHLEEQGSCLDQ